MSSKTDNRSMTLALLLAWEVTRPGLRGMAVIRPARLYSALAGDVTIGYGLKNSDRFMQVSLLAICF